MRQKIKLTKDDPAFYPLSKENADGEVFFYSTELDKSVRLLSFLEGEALRNVEYTPKLLFSFGKTLAKLDKKLLDYRCTTIESSKSCWNLQYYNLNKKYLSFITDSTKRNLVEHFFLQTREFVEPYFDELRKSVIHGDANVWNILVNDEQITGIIDFGDLCYSPLITELAIAIAYTALYAKDPIEDILPMIKGYNEVLPLSEREVELLYYLIPLRLCISVCHSAKAAFETPENEYVFINERSAWEMLQTWVRIDPVLAEDRFRATIGFQSKIADTFEKIN